MCSFDCVYDYENNHNPFIQFKVLSKLRLPSIYFFLFVDNFKHVSFLSQAFK